MDTKYFFIKNSIRKWLKKISNKNKYHIQGTNVRCDPAKSERL